MTQEEHHNRVKDELTNFASTHKSDARIFSSDKIVSICSSFTFKVNPYTLLSKEGKSFIQGNKSEIIFGLKSGFVFTKREIMDFELREQAC